MAIKGIMLTFIFILYELLESIMAKRRKKRKAKQRSWCRRLFFNRWFASLLLILLLVFLGWAAYLNYEVTTRFEGKKWAVPARVYARPLEVYQGLLLTPAAWEKELNALGYDFVSRPTKPGQVSKRDNHYSVYSRAFDFSDESVPAKRFDIVFNKTSVIRYQGPSADDFSARLDPLEIGSFYPSHGEDRVLVRLDDTPQLLRDAIVAVEDRHYYDHYGVSLRGTARAIIANLTQGSLVQGGSTITQQLVKNFYLTPERTLKRKAQEAMMALLLELNYDKSAVLETYINEINLGQSGPRAIHGFGLAANHYFNRDLNDLSPPQIALLVGMLKGPSVYNPRRNPNNARARRNVVLDILEREGFITAKELSLFKAAPLGLVRSDQKRLGDYPAFLDVVRTQLSNDYRPEDLQSEGLRIFTTMAPSVQLSVEEAITSTINDVQPRDKQPPLQAAAIVTAVGSGELLAIVGDAKPGYNGFKRATNARRQIGSLVKPFVYLTALKQPDAYTLMTLVDDSPFTYTGPNRKNWTPRNYTRRSYGLLPLYRALAYSHNQSTARLGMTLGLDAVIRTLRQAGLNDQQINPVPSLLLGSIALTPMEVSHIYHTIAADGVYTPLRAIRSVQDSFNQPLQRYPLDSEPRFSSELMHLMHYNLQAVMRFGTGSAATKRLPASMIAAGKTGTTNQNKDSWFAGYTGDHSTVIWMGNDNNKPTTLTGATGALVVWRKIMQNVASGSINHQPPDTIEYYWVDALSGLLSSDRCENAELVPFIRGSVPTQNSDCLSEQREPVEHWLRKWF